MIGATHITASGKVLSAGTVVRAVKAAKQTPNAWVKETFCSQFGGHGRDIVREFRSAVNDLINIRGGLVILKDGKSLHDRLNNAVRAGKIVQRCRWCGAEMPSDRYLQRHERFCDRSCASSYHS